MGDPRAVAAQSRIWLPGLTPLAAKVASDMLAPKDIDEAHMMMPAALPGPDDLAIALSPSGRTAAVIDAVEPAGRNGTRTIGGGDGSRQPPGPQCRVLEFAPRRGTTRCRAKTPPRALRSRTCRIRSSLRSHSATAFPPT
jgi:hypothetical protein